MATCSCVKPGRAATDGEFPIALYREGRELKALCGTRRGMPAPPETEVCLVCQEMVRVKGKGASASL